MMPTTSRARTPARRPITRRSVSARAVPVWGVRAWRRGLRFRSALVGNQNCGKTTLFNQLTGSNQHVGNFPGVTVDRKDGQVKGCPNVTITDLPGIYSPSPYTSEEVVSRRLHPR